MNTEGITTAEEVGPSFYIEAAWQRFLLEPVSTGSGWALLGSLVLAYFVKRFWPIR